MDAGVLTGELSFLLNNSNVQKLMCMATDYTLARSGVMKVCSCGFLASPLHFPAPLPQSAPVDRQPNEASKNKVPT